MLCCAHRLSFDFLSCFRHLTSNKVCQSAAHSQILVLVLALFKPKYFSISCFVSLFSAVLFAEFLIILILKFLLILLNLFGQRLAIINLMQLFDCL